VHTATTWPTGVWHTLSAQKGVDQVRIQLDSGPAARAQRTASAADLQMQPVGTLTRGTSSIVQARNSIRFMAQWSLVPVYVDHRFGNDHLQPCAVRA